VRIREALSVIELNGSVERVVEIVSPDSKPDEVALANSATAHVLLISHPSWLYHHT
jgi:hypothetical protein